MGIVLILADRACNKIVFLCKAHYYQWIINELRINSTTGNHTYSPTTLFKDEILQNHSSVLNILDNPGHFDDDNELPYLYWIPKLYKTHYKDSLLVPKQCSTRLLSVLLTKKY
jgi:hypothetical protein